jgi:hypothetical protein
LTSYSSWNTAAKLDLTDVFGFLKNGYEIPNAIVGTEIIFYYLPWNQDCIFTGHDKQITKPLDTIHNALRFDKPQRGLNNKNDSGDK